MIELETDFILGLALLRGQITAEEYWEEVMRELAVSIEVRRLSTDLD